MLAIITITQSAVLTYIFILEHGYLASKSSLNLFRNGVQILIEHKVARVQPNELCLWQITQASFGSRWHKE